MNKKSVLKSLSLILALVLLVGGVIGGTVAWLMTETESVVNTFTYGDINLDIDETGKKPGTDPDGGYVNEFEMMPGRELTKDPKIIVKAGSEACWLFAKVEKKGGDVTVGETTYSFDDFLEFSIMDGWTQLTDATGAPVEGVYFREVAKLPTVEDGGQDAEFAVIKDNKVTVKGSVTKEMLNALDADTTNTKFPTLTVTGYAVQKENIASAQDAWALADAQFNAPAQPNP